MAKIWWDRPTRAQSAQSDSITLEQLQTELAQLRSEISALTINPNLMITDDSPAKQDIIIGMQVKRPHGYRTIKWVKNNGKWGKAQPSQYSKYRQFYPVELPSVTPGRKGGAWLCLSEHGISLITPGVMKDDERWLFVAPGSARRNPLQFVHTTYTFTDKGLESETTTAPGLAADSPEACDRWEWWVDAWNEIQRELMTKFNVAVQSLRGTVMGPAAFGQ